MIKPPFPGDFDSLARQYWNTWNDMLGGSGGGFDGWSRPGGLGGMGGLGGLGGGIHSPFAAGFGGLAGGMPTGLGLGGFDPGAYEWYQRMQRLAAEFSDGGARAADVAATWRRMMEGDDGAKSFVRTLRSMQGGLAGGGWIDQVRPMLETLLRPLREQGNEWLHRPAFGPMREHQERLQALALAWQDWEQRNDDFNQLLARVGQDAFARFEVMLQACDQPGKRLESARALFDLWIEAAEAAWAELAFTEEYRKAYGEMTNAMMRLRLAVQGEVERFAASLGMPGRTEVDALARKVADLERAQHAARRAAARAAVGEGAAKPDLRKPVAAVVAAQAAVAAARSPLPSAVPAAASKPAKSNKAKKSKASAPRRKPAKAAKAAVRATPAPKAVSRRPAATTRPAAMPAQTAAKAPSRRAPTQSAARAKPQASTSTARKAKVAKSASAARKPASAAAVPATAKVVSMKDWVNRNLPGIEPPVAPARSGKSGRK